MSAFIQQGEIGDSLVLSYNKGFKVIVNINRSHLCTSRWIFTILSRGSFHDIQRAKILIFWRWNHICHISCQDHFLLDGFIESISLFVVGIGELYV